MAAQTVQYLGATEGQVNWGGNDDPRTAGLVPDGIYTIANTETHSWHTKIELVEFPGRWFNDASFAYLEA